MRPTRSRPVGSTARLLCGCAWLAAAAASALAQRTEPLPKELEGVGITEHLDAKLPLDAEFRDEEGRPVRLGAFFQGRRPVILTLNYYRCPMLCTLQLNGLVDALRAMPWLPGREFEIVTISFDPLETPTLARFKKQNYIKEYGRAEAVAGWHFLTGREDNIRRVTETVGFTYRYDKDTEQYVHAAALFVCTPDGRLSQYLYGVKYDPRTLRLSLLEASEGRTGSTFDQILMFCFHYDATQGRYDWHATNLMRAGGLLTLIVMGSVLGVFWRREARRRRPPTLAGAQS